MKKKSVEKVIYLLYDCQTVFGTLSRRIMTFKNIEGSRKYLIVENCYITTDYKEKTRFKYQTYNSTKDSWTEKEINALLKTENLEKVTKESYMKNREDIFRAFNFKGKHTH